MLVIALTGGLGSGKSTAAEYFRSRGAVILDLDAIAHDVLAKGSRTLDQVAEEFGREEVLLADGSLDRPALARLAFSSAEATRRLNAITHPAIAAQVGPAIRDIRLLATQPEAIVIEVPLLVEAPVFAEIADSVLAIVAPESVRVERVLARGMSEGDARRRIRAQATDAERAELANEVIVNAGSREDFIARLGDYWERVVAPVGNG